MKLKIIFPQIIISIIILFLFYSQHSVSELKFHTTYLMHIESIELLIWTVISILFLLLPLTALIFFVFLKKAGWILALTILLYKSIGFFHTIILYRENPCGSAPAKTMLESLNGFNCIPLFSLFVDFILIGTAITLLFISNVKKIYRIELKDLWIPPAILLSMYFMK